MNIITKRRILDYEALCRLHMPRTLRDTIDLDAVTEWDKLIGIDRSTASRLLRGERKFSTTHVRKTAAALGIEPSHLI